MTLGSTLKAGGMVRKEGCSELGPLSFQVIVTLSEVPTFLEMFKHLSASGTGV